MRGAVPWDGHGLNRLLVPEEQKLSSIFIFKQDCFFFVCFFTVKQGFLSLQKDLQCDIAEYLPLYRVPASHALHPGDTVWMRSEHVSFWSSLSSVRTQVQAEQ